MQETSGKRALGAGQCMLQIQVMKWSLGLLSL